MGTLTVHYKNALYFAFFLWAFVWSVGIATALDHQTLTWWPFWALMIPCVILVGPTAVRYYSTRVIVNDDTITIHRYAARTRTYRRSEIVGFALHQDWDGTSTAIVSFADGYRLTVSSYAEHFDIFREYIAAWTHEGARAAS
jgi:hypothetical protein